MMDSSEGFTRFTIMCSQSAGLQQLLREVRKAFIHNLFAERILQLFLQNSHRYSVPCFSSSLLFTICTGGIG